MEKIMTSAYNLLEQWTPLVWILVAISLVVTGICCIVGGETREKAKKNFPWILLGCVVVLGATLLAKEITGAFVF